MGASSSSRSEAKWEEEAPIFFPEMLTSTAYHKEGPPQDWSDAAFIIPHEALRIEMIHLRKSMDALIPTMELWRIKNFAKWMHEWFVPCVHMHHFAEERTYFPWLKSRVGTDEWPPRTAKQHVDIVNLLDQMDFSTQRLTEAAGEDLEFCITTLRNDCGIFIELMLDHLEEEEILFAPLLRKYFTREEEWETRKQIIEEGGGYEEQVILPSVFHAVENWATLADLSPQAWRDKDLTGATSEQQDF